MRISILGPLQVEEGGRIIPLGGFRQQAVLACLALRVNEIVPAGRLLAEVWGESTQPESTNALQAVISRVRKVLPSGRLVTKSGGYALRLLPGELDATEFEETLAEGRRALANAEAAEAAKILQRALRLWRGSPLIDFRYESFAQAEISRLEEMRLTCIEARIEAQLQAGAGPDLVAELTTLVAEHPLREKLRGHLMLALYRSGRQAEALDAFRDARDLLDGDLGLAPSSSLVALQAAILRHDPGLNVQANRDQPTSSPIRRFVTVLCVDVDVTDSNGRAVDPESLELLDGQVRDVFTPIVTRYGGRPLSRQIQSFQAIFGANTAHEDDAHRGALAAVEVQEGLNDHVAGWASIRGLRLASRLGVATAEALISGPEVTDVISESATAAQRLALRAEPGQVLINGETYRLAAGALDVGAGPAKSYTLINARFGSRPMALSLDVPLIGRRRELVDLCHMVEEAERLRRPALITVLGEPGVGKTRLVHEFTEQLSGRMSALTGRCLPYGEAITFWPLREIVHQATRGDHSPSAIENLLMDEPDATVIAGRLARAFGSGAPGTADSAEIFWATRKLFEVLARDEPLIVVLEDLHWADATFLDLVESLSVQPPPVPLLILALARPELLDLRPTWTSVSSQVIELKRLGTDEANALLDTLVAPADGLDATLRTRLLDVSAGNPLFLEQLVAWWKERAEHHELDLPPTIQALLAARLDLLEPTDRDVLACASVLGKDFHRAWVERLVPESTRAAVPRRLQMLERKGLIHLSGSDKSGVPDAEFRHALIQQAAYRMVPKARRAELHEQLANSMEGVDRDRSTQWVEIVAHHLEHATLYRRELQQVDHSEALAPRAAKYLIGAGDASLALGSASMAEHHFLRAGALLRKDDPLRPAILTRVGTALYEMGRLKEALVTLGDAQDLAESLNDEALRTHAQVQLLTVSLHIDPKCTATLVEPALPALLDTFMLYRDDIGLSRVWNLDGVVNWNRARSAPAEHAWTLAAQHARAAGDERELAWSLIWLASAALHGPTHCSEAIARCEQYLRELGDIPSSRALILPCVAGLHAMAGNSSTANGLLTDAASTLKEIGSTLPLAITEPAAQVALLADDLSSAERHLRQACDTLREMGEKYALATMAALLARVLVLQGETRYAEADDLVALSWESGAGEDLSATIVGKGARARILTAGGALRRGADLAEEAVMVAADTDFLNQHGDALMDLAWVRAASGDISGAKAASRQALTLYRRKGNQPAVALCSKYLANL